MVDAAARPLHRFPVFSTSNADEFTHLASKLLGATRIDLPEARAFTARVNLIELTEVRLAFGATTCEFAANHVAADFVRLQIAHKGRANTSAGGIITDINERQFAITPAGEPSRTACEAAHERLTLRLDEAALRRKLTALVGVRPRGELTFAPAIDAGRPYAEGMRRLVLFLAEQLNPSAASLPSAAHAELEQAIETAFLFASRHSFSHLLGRQEKAPASGVVRRIEEYIEANWQDGVTIERLAAVAGVSARSIFRAFEAARGYSPMAFAKTVRLKRARDALLSGDPRVNVTGIAFECNFANPGHFARDYRSAFGELPSETLLRARR
ncbi:MAG: AraC family transcriptional regulator [Bradyrhizobium sp.]|uniref:AraC family transcriptional regulator n=1 Tax=Bradyrhizobium sp. TaxID=376 RepID=UPI001E1411D9|nr:AraC family transcriptional regulator [Bradyrhizobium sp.]MBV9560670.1 AraC family transcriptional regulator [Bradyrhizobium sp.]